MRAKSGRGGPQMLTLCLRAGGHQGSEAEAFSEAQREEMAAAASERRKNEAESSVVGRRAK